LAAVLGCPADDVDLYTVVYQPFETGMMFWRQADQRIWALTTAQLDQGFDAWWRFQDEYDGGDQPVEDPPEGLLQPIRGFGEVWNTNGFIREALGWATGPEQQATVPWQDFDDGWMMAAPDGTIFVMIPDEEDPTTGRHSGPLP
ncbi:MAG: hypothetical protein GYB64_11985, partial [Chloroflexi bacterium]|nr:hypothetical protein [Chloroflexota bacterium]